MPENASGKLFGCDQCDYASNRSFDLRRHKQRHIRRKPIEGDRFKCSSCEFITKFKRNMKRHMQTHIKLEASEEEQTIEEFIVEVLETSDTELDISVKPKIDCIIDSPKDQTNNDSQIDKGPRIFKCDLCHYTTKRSFDLRRHKQTHYKVRVAEVGSHQCPKCSFVTKWKRNMRRHMQVHKKHIAEEEDAQQKDEQSTIEFTVELMDSEEVYMYNLYNAAESQSNLEKRYKCSLCYYETKRLFDLRRHLLMHDRAKPIEGTAYQCNNCSFSSKWKHNIIRHVRRRHNITSDACDAMDEELFNKVFIEHISNAESYKEETEALKSEEENNPEVLPSLWIALPTEEA